MEEYLLKAQTLDSSRSITANIAEGFGRFHHQENIQFCRQSRGSLDETLEHMITAYDENYITKNILSKQGLQGMFKTTQWIYKIFENGEAGNENN